MDDNQDRERPRRLQSVLKAIATALLVAAIVRELRTPREQRTWHGQVGFVPYDLRPPTLRRMREAWWNPDDPRVIVPRPFGVGWAVNLGRVVRLVRGSA